MLKKLILLALIVSLKITGAHAQSSDLAIIVNKNSGFDNVTSEELVKIFRAEKGKDPKGMRIVLTIREAGSPERAAALSEIYKMGEDDYAKYFLQATFVGLVQAAPRTMSSAAMVKQFVSTTPGGIGYVKASDVDDSVKVIKVDGAAPGESGYKLKLN